MNDTVKEELKVNDVKHNERLEVDQKNSNVHSMSCDMTFFDLSNPNHLNKLFERLEVIQMQESLNLGKRELPKAI